MTLAPGELLVFFTDGLLEARAADGKTMFGPQRLADLARGMTPDQPLAECAEQARAALDAFTASRELQDDVTVLLLRRHPHRGEAATEGRSSQ
jgi:serine phosphatase RsbU (regulator of sigma subunit)